MSHHYGFGGVADDLDDPIGAGLAAGFWLSPAFGPSEASARECGLTGTTKTISVIRQPADADAARSLAIPEGAEVIVRVRHMSLGDVEPEVVQVSTSIIPAALTVGTPLAGNVKITGGLDDYRKVYVSLELPWPGMRRSAACTRSWPGDRQYDHRPQRPTPGQCGGGRAPTQLRVDTGYFAADPWQR